LFRHIIPTRPRKQKINYPLHELTATYLKQKSSFLGTVTSAGFIPVIFERFIKFQSSFLLFMPIHKNSPKEKHFPKVISLIKISLHRENVSWYKLKNIVSLNKSRRKPHEIQSSSPQSG
jgi:hypothetical protein